MNRRDFVALGAAGTAIWADSPQPDRRQKLLEHSTPSASPAIVLNHRKTTYLYNMAHDLTLTSDASIGLSPGVVLVSYLAERALDAGCRFDFLKGAQDYKRRLGGVPRDLAAIVVEV